MAITIKKRNQPSGLYILAFAELWDRFSYYGIQALLVLYVTKVFLFSDNQAYGLYGACTALTFGTTVLGGLLADRLLGFRYAVIVGALLMIVGNIVLIFRGQALMYVGLAIMVCGISLFKPNNASLIGTFYKREDTRREAGFSIFYMGMNAGALLGPIAYGYLALHFGWHYGFIVSAVGMLIALVIFLARKMDTDENRNASSLKKNQQQLFYLTVLLAIGLFFFLLRHTQLFGHLLIVVGIATITGLVVAATRLHSNERHRLFGLSLLAFFCIFFFACSLQTATSLTLFIERNVNRDIFGFHLPTMMFMSLEPLFIILTAPFMASLWTWLNRHQWEIAPPFKIALGLLLAALSFAIFSFGANHSEANYTSLFAVIGGNLVLGIGELCVLPIAISAITQLAPTKMRGTMMGILFLALAYSGYLAGAIAKVISLKNLLKSNGVQLINYSHAFLDVFYVTLTISILMFCISPWLKRLLKK